MYVTIINSIIYYMIIKKDKFNMLSIKEYFSELININEGQTKHINALSLLKSVWFKFIYFKDGHFSSILYKTFF